MTAVYLWQAEIHPKLTICCTEHFSISTNPSLTEIKHIETSFLAGLFIYQCYTNKPISFDNGG